MTDQKRYVDPIIWQEALYHRRIYYHYFKLLAQRHGTDYDEKLHLEVKPDGVSMHIAPHICLNMTHQEFKRLHSLSFASLAVFYKLCEQYHRQLNPCETSVCQINHC